MEKYYQLTNQSNILSMDYIGLHECRSIVPQQLPSDMHF